MRTCADCLHCKQKKGVLAYCERGYWVKQDGTPKYITLAYLRKSKLANMAQFCDDYEGEET